MGWEKAEVAAICMGLEIARDECLEWGEGERPGAVVVYSKSAGALGKEVKDSRVKRL